MNYHATGPAAARADAARQARLSLGLASAQEQAAHASAHYARADIGDLDARIDEAREIGDQADERFLTEVRGLAVAAQDSGVVRTDEDIDGA